MIDVSIIVVNYNTRDLTLACIASIVKKTLRVSYEIIVVDNGSKECDASIFKTTFPEILLIESLDNLGFAGGNNLGISKAKGKYILLLNSDTELQNDAISIAIEKMQSDASIGVLSGQLQYPNGDVQAVAGKFPSIKNECIEFFRLTYFETKKQTQQRLLGDRLDYSQPAEVDWVWGAFFLFPKNILDHFPNKQLHEDFFMYFEDVLWCYFIKKKLGLKILYIPEPVVIHHLSGSSINKNLTEAFVTKILPNQRAFLIKQHGNMYAKIYYLIKGLHLLSLRKKGAGIYLKYVFKYIPF